MKKKIKKSIIYIILIAITLCFSSCNVLENDPNKKNKIEATVIEIEKYG